jgi:hypothetical protein
MTEIEIEVSADLNKKLEAFKKIVDTVLEEKTEQNGYLNMIISKGLEALLKMVISQDTEVLWSTIEKMLDENPKFVCDFVADMIKQGGEIKREEIKEKIQLFYIQ